MSASARVVPSPLLRRASQMKDKLVAKANTQLQKVAASLTPSKTKPEAVVGEYIKLLVVHCRARIKNAHDDGHSVILYEEEASSFNPDLKTLATICEESGPTGLLEALPGFNIPTLAGVIKLILQASDVPLLPLPVCGEVVFLHQKALREKVPLDVDTLRAALGKAPARSIDVLGQLCALLSKDATAPGKLAYSFGPLLFLPRFDHSNQVNKEYEGFDVMGSTPAIVGVTKVMIEQVLDIFSLDDERIIAKAALRLKGGAAPASSGGDAIAAAVAAAAAAHSSVATPTKYCAEFAFEAENANELSLFQGEVVQVLDKGTDGWWRGRNAQGQEGLFPGDYVAPAPVQQDDEEEEEAEEQRARHRSSQRQSADDAAGVSKKLSELMQMLEEERAARLAASELLEQVKRENLALLHSSGAAPVAGRAGGGSMASGAEFPLHMPSRPSAGSSAPGTPRPPVTSGRAGDSKTSALSAAISARLERMAITEERRM
jgi:hypothetical protein